MFKKRKLPNFNYNKKLKKMLKNLKNRSLHGGKNFSTQPPISLLEK